MTSDSELLRRYCEDSADSDSAFAELVQRYLGLVYSAALRQVGGNNHLAEEIAQIVFLLLARKAAALRRHPVLIGWLHTTTRLTALQMIKEELRRKRQENEFTTMESILTEQSSAAQWERLRPVIDEVIAELADTDRKAILLRFFSERTTFVEIGAALHLTEEAARKRVDRALDKLHAALAQRGIVSTSAALSVVLAGQAVSAAPAGLAVAVTGAALTGLGAASGAGGTSIGIITTFMSTFKAQAGIAALMVAAGTTGLVFQTRANTALEKEIATVRRGTPSIEDLKRENRRLVASADEVNRLRDEDAELGKLRDEVEAVKARQQEATRLEVAARQARSAQLATQAIYSEKELDQKPQVLRQGAPSYPYELREKGVSGTVLLSYIVTTNGEVADVKIVNATDPALGKAAADAVEKWLFAPGMKNGQQVNVRIQLPVSFDLGKPNEALSPEQMKRQLANRWF